MTTYQSGPNKSWIFKSFTDATATVNTDATARAANKTEIFKSFGDATDTATAIATTDATASAANKI